MSLSLKKNNIFKVIIRMEELRRSKRTVLLKERQAKRVQDAKKHQQLIELMKHRAKSRETRRAQLLELNIPPTTIKLRSEVRRYLIEQKLQQDRRYYREYGYPQDSKQLKQLKPTKALYKKIYSGYQQQDDTKRKVTDGSQDLSTQNVNADTLKFLKSSSFGRNFFLGEPIKLPVYPIGFILRCHQNATVFSKLNPNFERVDGYTIVACPCHRHGTLELHSVVRNKKTRILYDITDDKYDEQEKWFVQINTDYVDSLMKFKLIEFGKCSCNPIVNCKMEINYFISYQCPHITDSRFQI